MNAYQMIITAFALAVVAISFWAVWAIIRSPRLKLKPLWIAGSVLGFPVGLGINWTTPNDFVVLFGITVPAVWVFTVVATGQTIIKTGFPILAIAALIATREAENGRDAAGTVGDNVS